MNTIKIDFDLNSINYDKANNLIPAIIQHEKNLEVLMLGYMNKESLSSSLETGFVTFFSRSKNRLWKKGETSGNFLHIKKIQLDCDNDSLLIFVDPQGPTCHEGTSSCFDKVTDKKTKGNYTFFSKLEYIIENRISNDERNTSSYVSQLYKSGIKRIAQKVGEEGVEVALAGLGQNHEEIIYESADLIFHLLVLLKASSLSLQDIVNELEKRN